MGAGTACFQFVGQINVSEPKQKRRNAAGTACRIFYGSLTHISVDRE